MKTLYILGMLCSWSFLNYPTSSIGHTGYAVSRWQRKMLGNGPIVAQHPARNHWCWIQNVYMASSWITAPSHEASDPSAWEKALPNSWPGSNIRIGWNSRLRAIPPLAHSRLRLHLLQAGPFHSHLEGPDSLCLCYPKQAIFELYQKNYFKTINCTLTL